ncbi:hypothetical protein [Allorhodopirellula heiligendammensis]|uniref:hypothetical protein n=1 Tax=Allorhodopirellula heiligendammensis TaxID=2714739 RepID=UPI0011B5F885|nr:hypothetical protein [Allorhodopirellula heiligendammensis]
MPHSWRQISSYEPFAAQLDSELEGGDAPETSTACQAGGKLRRVANCSPNLLDAFIVSPPAILDVSNGLDLT